MSPESGAILPSEATDILKAVVERFKVLKGSRWGVEDENVEFRTQEEKILSWNFKELHPGRNF